MNAAIPTCPPSRTAKADPWAGCGAMVQARACLPLTFASTRKLPYTEYEKKGSTVQYDFEWDPTKARQNHRKHGVAFERAAEVFLDPLMLSLFDEQHSADEDRWITLGTCRDGTCLAVVHTFCEVDARTASIRIISARRATKTEAKQYSSR